MNAIDDCAVDVVIPVRNGDRFIKACLDSVKAQTRAPRAIVVVDDGSMDGTAAIVETYMERWPALQLVRTDKRGLPHARNTGIANCQAPFVAFLDSDDVWEPRKLERQMEVFSTAPSQIGFVHCSYYHMDEDGQHIKGAYIVAPRRRNDFLHDLLLEGNIVSGSGSAVVARCDLLERAGGFDERLTFAEDWDLWLRLAETAELDFVPDALVGIRLHDKSMQRGDRSQNEERFLRQRLLILDRWYQAPRFTPYACDEYRRMVADVAIQKIKARGPPWLSGEQELYRSIKFGASRFGRDLFSSRFDFLAEIYGPVPLARRLLTKIVKMGLSPAQYGALKGVVRSRRRMKVKLSRLVYS